jgi:hypothetical protein
MNINKNHGSTGDKIIIKETGKEDTIKDAYSVVTYNVSFTYDINDISDMVEEDMIFTHHDTKPEGWYYITPEGKEYHEDKLIVGKDDIRDYKINQINNGF